MRVMDEKDLLDLDLVGEHTGSARIEALCRRGGNNAEGHGVTCLVCRTGANPSATST